MHGFYYVNQNDFSLIFMLSLGGCVEHAGMDV